jgi:PPK2 family polyphosphate:nucleotide phosphotransferase
LTKVAKLADRYRITKGEKFALKTHDPADTAGMSSKGDAVEALQELITRTARLQEMLYAQGQWSVLLVLQAMDAAGKDGLIKHVMTGVNPQGCSVVPFKEPSQEELQHDFIWRAAYHLPERGHIGIFNRSYYEEVLVVRVHPKILQGQKIPPSLVTRDIWKQRFEDIRGFERHLVRNGTVIRKFFLNVSRDEQKRRFLGRLEEPRKNWKFSAADVHERAHWRQYMSAYEEMIRETSTPDAPWFVIPADNKWFTRLAVSSVIVQTLEELNLSYPKLSVSRQKELTIARKKLERKE